MLAAAASAWDALRQPDPSALAVLATAGAPELPFLGAALRRLLEELPAPKDGLSGTERRALQAIAAGAATPLAVFHAAQDLEAAPFLGDAWFYRTLTSLGRGQARLIETPHGEQPATAPRPSATSLCVLRLVPDPPESDAACQGQAGRRQPRSPARALPEGRGGVRCHPARSPRRPSAWPWHLRCRAGHRSSGSPSRPG